MAGIGAAIGEFTRGYATGLKLSSDLDDAKKKRDLYQAEIDTRNQALEKSKKIDAAREELATATKGFFPMPDGSDPIAGSVGIKDPVKMEQLAAQTSANYRNAMFKYLSIADPSKLDDFRRNTKSEDMQIAALDAARVTAGLMTQDPRALEKAAQMNGILGPGETLDLKRSAFEKDKSVRFAINGADGKPLPDQVMSRDQIHFMGYRFLNDPNAMMQHASTFARDRETQALARETLDENVKARERSDETSRRGQDLSYSASMAHAAASGANARESAASRADAKQAQLIQSGQKILADAFAPSISAIKDDLESRLTPGQRRIEASNLSASLGVAQTSFELTTRMGKVPNLGELANPDRMKEIRSGVGVLQLYDHVNKREVPGYGITRDGNVVPFNKPKDK